MDVWVGDGDDHLFEKLRECPLLGFVQMVNGQARAETAFDLLAQSASRIGKDQALHSPVSGIGYAFYEPALFKFVRHPCDVGCVAADHRCQGAHGRTFTELLQHPHLRRGKVET